jgi:tagatose-1,6-bisphosphate aldolase non-catalytic subunit AgaZ/GatZ
MNDSVKYQLERAEDALRTALKFADQESVYVISAISKALIEIDNTMFAERIEAAAKAGNTAAQGLISIDKEEREDGKVEYKFNYSDINPYTYYESQVTDGL